LTLESHPVLATIRRLLSRTAHPRPWLLENIRGLRLGAFASALAIGTAVANAPAPVNTVAGVASMLGEAVGQIVAPKDIRWEPSRGEIADLVLGRRVLFLASEQPDGPRDVWRAAVRVTPEGRPLDVTDTHNLTSTPLGDDHALVADGDYAGFATYAFGQEQSVSLLDLRGLPPPGPLSVLERVTRWLTNTQETGSGEGVGRVEVTLDQPAVAVGLAIRNGSLVLDLEDPGGVRRHAEVDCDKGELSLANGAPSGLHVETVRHLPKRFILWAVDTARAVPWIGPAPVAWLEEHVFAVQDELRRMAFKARGADATETLADVAAPPAPPPIAVLDASQASEEGHWPPENLASIWKTLEPGEGVWVVPHAPWMRRADPTAPSPFVRTFVRPDPDRPYTRVILVAMDMRQLDLAMEAGTEDPKPLTGGHGPGRIPRDPAIFTRVVAAFNGAFKTEHGNYGMMVHKRVLLPPQSNAASVIVLADQRVGFGTWADTHDVGRIRGIDPAQIDSFRQNLDPLVDQGEVNPMGRSLWGYTLPGQGMQTERTAICVTMTGHIVYAWGDDVSGTALGKAMKMGGCTYAMHLDMNPHHTGFIFASVDDLKNKTYKSELLSPLMTVSPERYIEYAPKDFFYVLLHDPTPPPVASVAWRTDGPEPPPAWAPALWSARIPGEGAVVDLLDIESGRATFRIRAGTKEPDSKTGASPLHELDDADAHKVMLAIGLGRATEKRPRGLATDGRLAYPLASLREGADKEELAVLVAPSGGVLAILKGEELASIAPHTDLAEVPLLLDAGALTAAAQKSGPTGLRYALGTAGGRVLVAHAVASSPAPLAEALRRAGCSRAVALDRGDHSPSFVHRAGSDTPPRGRYDDSVLYALVAPLVPRAFRFEADSTLAEAGKGK
jgi:hypothetical protein